MKSTSLKVSGASIYYEKWGGGAGPTLLIIPGGAEDAGVFADLSRRLADHYTVVAYDPRGNSRSAFEGEPEVQELDVHGDDAVRLLAELDNGPAYVFGTSGGAQIGLNVAARYPEYVRTLVAHEPPTVLMLDDPSEALAGTLELYITYRLEGVDAAMAKFFAMNDLEEQPKQEEAPSELAMTPEAAETFARVSGNFEYWLAHGLLPLSLYRPDVDALREGGARIVVGIGEESTGQPIYDMGMALSKKLGTEPVMFPGDHMGFNSHTDRFAETLNQALN